MHSSVFFQILTFFNLWYLAIFTLAEIALYIFKFFYLPYPASYAACDIIILVLALILELLRIEMGRNGNLTERQVPIIACLILTVPCVVAAVYVLLWQTYVLRIEIILSSIMFVFQGLEILCCNILAIGFTKRTGL